MNTAPDPDKLNRLALSMMEKYNETYDQAIHRLENLKLLITCGPSVKDSIVYQAALLTAINCGKRAFLGGVMVTLPHNSITHVTGLPGGSTLNDVIEYYGGNIVPSRPDDFDGFVLTIGQPAEPHDNSLQVVCNSWQGGVLPYGYIVQLTHAEQFCFGAVAAAAIAVGAAFMKLSGLDNRCADTPVGISLWRPDLDWLSPEAGGGPLTSLPEKLWVLGLGHLGQTYLWNFSLLPFEDKSRIRLMLQDDDKVSEANRSAGLLVRDDTPEIQKTVLCREWLAAAGIQSLVTERRFDENTIRARNEPCIAVCGFDNAESRQYLENAGFDLVVEAGLGGGLSNFDDITMHSFPSANHSSKELWKATKAVPLSHKNVLNQFAYLEKNGCGMITLNLASKAISSSFVGALAGAFVISEVVRAANCGPKFDQINAQVRSFRFLKCFQDGIYSAEAAQNGLINACKPNC